MAIEVERKDGVTVRAVVVGMIVSRAVLGPISARWEPNLFDSRVCNLIGGWCVEYYRKYRRAPGTDIFGCFDEWAATTRDRDLISGVEDILSKVETEYERLKKTVSPDYLVDKAARCFRLSRLAQLRDGLDVNIVAGDVDRAEDSVKGYRRIELGLGAGLAVLAGDDVAYERVARSLEEVGEEVFSYDGALAAHLKSVFVRDSFVAFMGKEKIGKSFWLLDVAWRAVLAGRRVAYFECGDMSESQVLRRVVARAAGRPARAGVWEYPVIMDPSDGGLPCVRRERRVADCDMTPEAALNALTEAAGAPDLFNLSCHPTGTMSVSGAGEIMEAWERDGWVPDLVVFDYADIVAPSNPRADKRDQINTTWMEMKAVSQRLHCCVVTATQTDTASYSVRTLSRENFSEDKRKYAHVSTMIGLNQDKEEKDKGIYRLNLLAMREREYSERLCCHTAACLATCEPAVLSTF